MKTTITLKYANGKTQLFPNADAQWDSEIEQDVASGAMDSAFVRLQEETEFAEYLIADTDFGGAWNDAEQINIHLV